MTRDAGQGLKCQQHRTIGENLEQGGTTSSNVFQGLEVDLRLLRGMAIKKKERKALLQGRVYADSIINALWDGG
jgi:hypothetical protein